MIHLGRMNYTPVVVFDAEVTKERSVSSFHSVQIFGHICHILVGRDGLDPFRGDPGWLLARGAQQLTNKLAIEAVTLHTCLHQQGTDHK